MKLWFLPFVREGITPATVAAAHGQAEVSLRLSAPGRTARDITRRLDLLGPGDVLQIEPRQILRTTPSPGSQDAEPDFFPSIEFDAPDLPWTYSPTLPQGSRLLPWIVLVVIEAQPGVSVDRAQGRQAPWILRLPLDVAHLELPDLSDSWAWAHAQVACESSDQIASTLAGSPDRTLARLIASRRLLPHRRYHACVVPAYRTGRVSGLGGDPSNDPAVRTGSEPAWSATDIPTELPVYHTWTFRTGDTGDFEALAQRLRPTPLDASVPPLPLQVSVPKGASSLVVDWEAPLRVPGSAIVHERRPATAVAQIRDSLKGGGNPPVMGPSYFGASWLNDRPLDPQASWAPELNLTPMHRAAAGLGAEAVRGEQEELVAAVSAQLEAYRKAQQEGRRKQLSASVVNRVKMRLAAATPGERARVFAPMMAQAQGAASNVGMYTVAGRRVTRKTWQVRPAIVAPVTATMGTIGTTGTTGSAGPTGPTGPTGPVGPVGPTGTVATSGEIATGLVGLPATELADAPLLIAEIVYRPPVIRIPVTPGPLPVTPVDPTTIDDGQFAPRFSRPMSEPLAERFPELMLPGIGSIPGDGVLLVESNPAFVEAYLVGANQELNYELLWRGLPADRRATAFHRFWRYADAAEDIASIPDWVPASPVGSHVTTPQAMVLLIRGELVRRYPSVLISAVPAIWNPDGTRSPDTTVSSMVLPAFRGRIGADILYAGFPQPTLAEAVGAPVRTGPAGWFLLLSENPGDPRFGLDPDGGSAPPTRANLSWTHLQLAPDATYASAPAFPNVPDAGFTPQNATAASLAGLVRQRTFRVFMHASLLVRPPS